MNDQKQPEKWADFIQIKDHFINKENITFFYPVNVHVATEATPIYKFRLIICLNVGELCNLEFDYTDETIRTAAIEEILSHSIALETGLKK
jgi:hypothetical protein